MVQAIFQTQENVNLEQISEIVDKVLEVSSLITLITGLIIQASSAPSDVSQEIQKLTTKIPRIEATIKPRKFNWRLRRRSHKDPK